LNNWRKVRKENLERKKFYTISRTSHSDKNPNPDAVTIFQSAKDRWDRVEVAWSTFGPNAAGGFCDNHAI
jgi:hypothetical protein